MSSHLASKLPKPNGKPNAPIVIVGDAPTQEELDANLAFAGANQDLMVDLLRETGYTLSDVVFVNAVSFPKFAKRSGKLTAEDINTDAADNLLPFITRYPRKLVVALGNNALCAIGATTKPAGINDARARALDSKALQDRGLHCAITASIHPYSVLKEPIEAEALITDLQYARRLVTDGRLEQAPMVIKDIECIEDVYHLIEEFRVNPFVAYDFEATGLDCTEGGDFPVSLTFCNGLKDAQGRYIVWFWGGYDRLVPRYDEATMNAFINAFRWLFRKSGTDYDLIAWNQNYDDWMRESWLGEEMTPSAYDGMYMKYTVNTKRPHDLKSATAYYLGYPNYDKAVDDAVKEIAKRRQKILSHEDDFLALKLFGHTPVKTRTGYKWPVDIENEEGELIYRAPDRKLAAYALQPWDTLRTYNSYDSLYTYLLFEKLGATIEDEDLVDSCDLRHRLGRELLRCEQRGMQLNIGLNREFSKELKEVEKNCKREILNRLHDLEIDMPDFNPNSSDQLIRVLYGEPVMLPMFDAGKLAHETGWDYAIAVDRCQLIEEQVYGEDLEYVKDSYRKGLGFDTKAAKAALIAGFKRKWKSALPEIYEEQVYCNGLYEPIAWTKGGKPSTAGAVLQTLYQMRQHDFLLLLLMLRRASKLRGTFVDGIYKRCDKHGILRSHFNPVGTETGRISSSNPNGQNFQKSVRGQLIPRVGYKFLEWDLSQAEVRAVAAYSGDKDLMAALDSEDIHTTIASMVFNVPYDQVDPDTHRKYAKTIVFGIIYGMTKYRLSMAINVDVEKAQEFIDLFFARFPKLKIWLDGQVTKAHEAPYYVYTPWGTRRSTRNVLSIDKKTVLHTERIATNMPIQGAAGELTLYFICEIMDRIRERGFDCWLVNTTHDSCTLEVEDALAWTEVVGKNPKTGKDIVKVFGPVAEIVADVIKNSPLPSPLDKVNFEADIELNEWWSAKPDLKKALDPKSEFNWQWIKPEEILGSDSDELKELREIELVATGSVNF